MNIRSGYTPVLFGKDKGSNEDSVQILTDEKGRLQFVTQNVPENEAADLFTQVVKKGEESVTRLGDAPADGEKYH